MIAVIGFSSIALSYQFSVISTLPLITEHCHVCLWLGVLINSFNVILSRGNIKNISVRIIIYISVCTCMFVGMSANKLNEKALMIFDVFSCDENKF